MGSLLAAHKLLNLMEAAIGIEPMNKGFAVHFSYLAQNIMEHHRCVNTGFSHRANYSVMLYVCK